MEAVGSDKKLFGNKGNDIVSGGSLPHTKAAWFPKKPQPFANENVANAAKERIDAFFAGSAKKKKKKKKKIGFSSQLESPMFVF